MTKALMIIDVQASMFFGEWRIPNSAELLVRIGDRLMQARIDGTPVIHVQNDGDEAEMDAPGEPYWHLVFGVLDSELVFRKTRPNLFENSEVAQELRARGVSSLEIIGVQSDMCVRASCIGALENGFQVSLDRNMHATFDGGWPGATEGPSATELSDQVQSEVENWKKS
jgi:streptothricin hydrolase